MQIETAMIHLISREDKPVMSLVDMKRLQAASETLRALLLAADRVLVPWLLAPLAVTLVRSLRGGQLVDGEDARPIRVAEVTLSEGATSDRSDECEPACNFDPCCGVIGAQF